MQRGAAHAADPDDDRVVSIRGGHGGTLRAGRPATRQMWAFLTRKPPKYR
jgi:hypothetical protein